MTPIEIIDQMIKELPEDFFWQINMWKDIALHEVRERIMNECTVHMSDWYEEYEIPYILLDKFVSDKEDEPKNTESEEWDNWFDMMDAKYSDYYV